MKKAYYFFFKRKVYKRFIQLSRYSYAKKLAITEIEQLRKDVKSLKKLLSNPYVHFSPYYIDDYMKTIDVREKRISDLSNKFKLN